MGSVMTNKYAEGYPGKRYYGGCEFVDVVEESARSSVPKNYSVQNMPMFNHTLALKQIWRCFLQCLQPGDTVLWDEFISWWSFNTWFIQ